MNVSDTMRVPLEVESGSIFSLKEIEESVLVHLLEDVIENGSVNATRSYVGGTLILPFYILGTWKENGTYCSAICDPAHPFLACAFQILSVDPLLTLSRHMMNDVSDSLRVDW